MKQIKEQIQGKQYYYHHIKNKALDEVYHQVSNKIWDHIHIPVWFRIKNPIEEVLENDIS